MRNLILILICLFIVSCGGSGGNVCAGPATQYESQKITQSIPSNALSTYYFHHTLGCTPLVIYSVVGFNDAHISSFLHKLNSEVILVKVQNLSNEENQVTVQVNYWCGSTSSPSVN